MMFLNIITQCSRPENLFKISASINIPRKNYRWIVVFDSETISEDVMKMVPDNCEFFANKNPKSIVGNAQRNYALDMVTEGHVYFNDDDTLIHPYLWKNVYDLDKNDFISFMQLTKNGKMRFLGNEVGYERTDSHNFIVDSKIIGDKRWVLDRYQADGIFAGECYKESKSFLYLPLTLSIYNMLKQ